VHDIIKVLRHRAPYLKIILIPAIVQGADAPESIAKAIASAQKITTPHKLDVLIVGRGGGSMEELWAFNEEIVARAIASSKIPTVSAVGHEVDFTIADFVADLRAPTPSAAAEYSCSPANKKNPDRDIYLLNVNKKNIELGYFENDLKIGKLEKNRNMNYLKNFLQFGGEISRLRGEGYLQAFISPSMTASAQTGVMYLGWGGSGPTLISKYLCKQR
jgi:exodeoxyribonuclease VII large subunit